MTVSLLGAIAAHYVATPPAPPAATVVTPQRVGRPKGTSWGGGSSVTAALPQTPTAGNTLIAVASSYGFASFTATMTTPAGWTAGPARVETGGGTRPALFMFWKLATGSESNPTFNVNSNGASSGQVTITEWRGLDTSAPHLADSAGANVAGTGNQSLTDSITTTTANEWVFTAIGTNGVSGFGPNGNGPVITWDAPQLPWDFPEMANQASAAWASGCYPSAGVKAPHVTFNMVGGVSTNIASMSFKIAAGSRPQVAESAWSEATGPTWVATLQTTPDPSDVLICALVHNGSIGAASISGCGATWTVRQVHDAAGDYDMHVWTGINPTGGGAVTVTTANSVQGKIRVLRASGAGNTVATSYARNPTAAASFTGPTVTAGPGQLVVALQAASGTGASDVPIASASPGLSNWMTDTLLKINVTNGSAQDAWLVPSAPGTSCNVTGTSATTRLWPTTMVVVG